MKVKKFHTVVNRIISPFLISTLKRKFNLICDKSDIKPPFLCLINHATDFDAFFVAHSFKNHLYFVMSDHITTIPVAGKLVRGLVSPLPITKSTLDVGTVREIMEVIKQGGAVAIFPEGNKSFAGDVSYIKPSTAKLAKKLNVPLVIFNIEGGFFASPRYKHGLKRKGKIHAFVKEIIYPSELEKLSVDEIYKRIVTGLNVNAYEVQKRENVFFKGDDLADNIETTLFACPECNSISSLQGKGNDIICNHCGKKVSLNNYGYIEGGKFNRLDHWDKWQKQLLLDMKLDKIDNNTIITEDSNWEVAEKQTKYKSTKIGMFSTKLYSDRLVLFNDNSEHSIPLSTISGMAIEGVNGLQIWLSDDKVLRLKNDTNVSALKYADMIWAIKHEAYKF